jgi:branched-chain amino acid transport system substrate-binding protein
MARRPETMQTGSLRQLREEQAVQIVKGLICFGAGLVLGLPAANAADPLKLGLIWPYSGPSAEYASQTEGAIKLFMQQRGDSVAGRKLQIIRKDETSPPSPDVAKRLAQELVVQDKVDFMMGIGFTPDAIAVGQISTPSKTPVLVTSTLGVNVLKDAPYMARLYSTIPQIIIPLAQWIAKQGTKKVFLAHSDYGPGNDARDWFTRAFTAAGGEIVGTLPVGIRALDFSAEMQRIKNAKPDAVFVWLPTGPQTRTFINQYRQGGLDKAGIKLFGDGNLTDEQSMQAYGDEALGIITAYNYSDAHDSALNRAFVQDFRKIANGVRPGILAVTAYDALQTLYKVVEAQSGTLSINNTMAQVKALKLESPRGAIEMDPDTRDVTQDIYMRRVERRDDELVNVEFDRFPAVPPVPKLPTN